MKIGELIKHRSIKNDYQHSFPEDQGLATIEKRDKSAELLPLSSLSDDENEVDRLKQAV